MSYLALTCCIWLTFMTLRAPKPFPLANLYGVLATAAWVALAYTQGWLT